MAIVFIGCVAEDNGGDGFHIEGSLQGKQSAAIFLRLAARRNGGGGFVFSLKDRERFGVPASVSDGDAREAFEIAKREDTATALEKISRIASWAKSGGDLIAGVVRFVELVKALS